MPHAKCVAQTMVEIWPFFLNGVEFAPVGVPNLTERLLSRAHPNEVFDVLSPVFPALGRRRFVIVLP